MKPPLKPAPANRPPGAPERRSARAELRVPVLVRWLAKDGTPKEETTETGVANAHGCLVLLRATVFEGLGVEIVNLQTRQGRKGTVVWCGRIEKGGLTRVGIEIEKMDEQFWGERYSDFLLWLAKQRG